MMELVKADILNVGEICEIYDSVKNTDFCVWNENYPTAEHAENDIAAECLYLLKDGENILGCISIEPEAEDDDLPFWRVCDGTHREISRVAVSPRYQKRGYARIMVELLLEIMKKEGINSAHLLAAKRNLPAVALYRSLGFDFLGDCYRYGSDYYVCEKILQPELDKTK